MKHTINWKTIFTIIGIILGQGASIYLTSVVTASKVSYNYGEQAKAVDILEKSYSEKVEPAIVQIPQIVTRMGTAEGRLDKIEYKLEDHSIAINRVSNVAGKALDGSERATESIMNISTKLDYMNNTFTGQLGELKVVVGRIQTGIEYLKDIKKN